MVDRRGELELQEQFSAVPTTRALAEMKKGFAADTAVPGVDSEDPAGVAAA